MEENAPPQHDGETCELCHHNVLWLVHGAVVCPECDNARNWPSVKR